MNEPTAITVRITGRVQGVAFRAWTENEAKNRGLTGWVRNEGDGSVTALIGGARDRVEDMLAALHRGPPRAHVEHIETTPATPEGRTTFEIRR
ncbi:MAG: acylphosphatase [Pseudomonadota bacterium]|uniref:acylphosphatase n=1 Tax=Roseovarius TaxID=74030 RepID=UPI0022A8C5AA|nr:acylphosphatase [Roseovarius sp. EGI FJ00037]MCZ0812957.1 acylphosphatase [Roseovarius sp. EGI FJ00037]